MSPFCDKCGTDDLDVKNGLCPECTDDKKMKKSLTLSPKQFVAWNIYRQLIILLNDPEEIESMPCPTNEVIETDSRFLIDSDRSFKAYCDHGPTILKQFVDGNRVIPTLCIHFGIELYHTIPYDLDDHFEIVIGTVDHE